MITHRQTNIRLYKTWDNMKQRCYNEKHDRYKDWGGRGIKVFYCWYKHFEAFRNWAILNGYSDALTIDRIDNNGNYEPNNCRWVTKKVQQRNKTTNRIIEFRNEARCLADWRDILNIGYNSTKSRLDRGWSVDKAFNYKNTARQTGGEMNKLFTDVCIKNGKRCKWFNLGYCIHSRGCGLFNNNTYCNQFAEKGEQEQPC